MWYCAKVRRGRVPHRRGFAMVVVLGLIAILGISLANLFDTVIRGDHLVEKGFRDFQNLLVARSAVSWGVARLQNNPEICLRGQGSWLEHSSSLGFRVSLAQRGVFSRIVAFPIGDVKSNFRIDANVGRVWIPRRMPALVLWQPGDVTLMKSGGIFGGIVSEGSVENRGGVKSWEGDTSKGLPSWLSSGLDTSFISSWQIDAQETFLGMKESLSLMPVSKVAHEVGKTLSLGYGVWVLDQSVVLDSIECDQCVLLARNISVQRKVRISDGVIWSRSNFNLHGEISGSGQFLATDTLNLVKLMIKDSGIVLAAIGRPAVSRDLVPTGRSTALIRIESSSGSGTIVAFSSGRISRESRPVLECDALSHWHGTILVRGLTWWNGSLEGTLFSEHLIGRRPEGAIQEGGLQGVLKSNTSVNRISLPWIGDQRGLAGVPYWRFNEIP